MDKVLVIGISVIDQIMHVNSLPKPGETILSKEMELVIGGKGLNQAVGLKRLNVDADFISVIGEDNNGSLIKDFLAKEGLSNHLYVSENLSGTSFITLDRNKENSIAVSLNSNKDIGNYLADIYKIIDNYNYVILQGELDFNFNEQIINYCSKNNIKIIFNCAPADEKYINLISKIDYLIVNEEEFLTLNEDKIHNNIENDIEKFCDKYQLTNLIVTVGKAGSYVYDQNQVTHLSAHAANVVSTIGAGDSYVAGFAFGLVNKNSILDSCEIASTIATLKIENVSAAYGMPTFEQYKGRWKNG